MRSILYVILFVAGNPAIAQTVVNGGFENWAIDSNNNAVPNGWYSNETAEFSVAQSPNANDGFYASRLMSRSPGIEGPYYGYITTKVAAEGSQGVLTCMIAVDSLQHYQNDTAFALIQIDTTWLYDGWVFNPLAFGAMRIGTETNGYVPVSVPFQLPSGIDSFYVHLVAKNITLPFTNLQMGYASFRADDVAVTFVTSTKPLDGHAGIELYPNPSSGKFFLKGHERFQTYAVYDLNGRRIQSGLAEPIIDLTNLANGLYRIAMQNENGAVASRAVVVGLD